MSIPQFKIRKIRGVTEIRLPDDSSKRADVSNAFKEYAPLLAEISRSVPSFEELKGTREVREFIDAAMSAGDRFTFVLQVRGIKDSIIAKEVLIVDETRKICAISRWTPEDGIKFARTN
jgi:hypothetical protein